MTKLQNDNKTTPPLPRFEKRRRLETVIGGGKPDRVPVALWRHWQGDDQDAEAMAAVHLQWQRDYDWDLLKVGPASSYSVDDWGMKTKWVGDIEGTREVTYCPAETAVYWKQLRPLNPQKGMLATQIEALRLIGEGLRGETPFTMTIFSPLTQVQRLAGKEKAIIHMRQHPDLLHLGLQTATESTLRFIEAAKKTGISGIFYAVQHARYPLMSRDEFMTFARPYDLQILEAVSDLWCNMVHIHGTNTAFDWAADYPAHFVNWHDRETDVSLKEGLTRIKGAASGGIDHWTLHQESPEAMLVEAEDALEQVNGRRLLLGTGCVAMATTPIRNIRALREFV